MKDLSQKLTKLRGYKPGLELSSLANMAVVLAEFLLIHQWVFKADCGLE